MIHPQRYFPWKIAKKIFVSHFGFSLLAVILAGLSLRFFVYRDVLSHPEDVAQSLARFDRHMTELWVGLMVVLALYYAYTSFRFSRPLGRLIQKTRELRRLDVVANARLTELEDFDEELGEWYDLERAVDRLSRDLRKKATELSREREELTALLTAVPEAILAVDQTETPLFFNAQFSNHFDLPHDVDAQRSIGLAEIFRVPEVLMGFRDVLSMGKRKEIQTSLRVSSFEKPRFFSISISPLIEQGESSQTYGAIGIFHDVTLLKQSEQIRIEFVGNASHELRTPLTNVKGYLETVKADVQSQRWGDVSQFIDIISRNVDRLIALVNDLLDLSSIESGAKLNFQVINVQELTELALKQVESKRAVKGHRIQTVYDTNYVYGDFVRIEQVLINLVHNAIKYVPPGGQIEIRWTRQQNGVSLHVKDNGPGIASVHHDRLFERFYRVDPGRSREQGGTGLGLSIVKHVVQRHEGQVRLKSELGKGSEFICFFPDR